MKMLQCKELLMIHRYPNNHQHKFPKYNQKDKQIQTHQEKEVKVTRINNLMVHNKITNLQIKIMIKKTKIMMEELETEVQEEKDHPYFEAKN